MYFVLLALILTCVLPMFVCGKYVYALWCTTPAPRRTWTQSFRSTARKPNTGK